MNIIQTLQEYVNKGCDFLDKEIPDWHSKINLKTLKISDCYKCVLGQLLGFYSQTEGTNIPNEDFFWLEEHGFTILYIGTTNSRFTILTIIWIETIARRYRQNDIIKKYISEKELILV